MTVGRPGSILYVVIWLIPTMTEYGDSATDPGRTLENGKQLEMGVKACVVVIHSKYAETETEVQDEEVLLSGANDILAIIT